MKKLREMCKLNRDVMNEVGSDLIIKDVGDGWEGIRNEGSLEHFNLPPELLWEEYRHNTFHRITHI